MVDERDHAFLADVTTHLPDHQIHLLPRSGKCGGGIYVSSYAKGIASRLQLTSSTLLNASRKMNDILQSAGLTQHVTEPTHIRVLVHMLDLLITRDIQCEYVFNVSVQHTLPSDHSAVICDVLISRPKTTKRVINSRKLREIDMEVLRNEISDRLDVDQSDDVNTMALSYDSTLRTLLDAHAP